MEIKQKIADLGIYPGLHFTLILTNILKNIFRDYVITLVFLRIQISMVQDKEAFTLALKRISRIQKTSGASYVVLRDK